MRKLLSFAAMARREGWGWMLTQAMDGSFQVGLAIADARFASKPKPSVREALENLQSEMVKVVGGIEWEKVGEVIK